MTTKNGTYWTSTSSKVAGVTTGIAAGVAGIVAMPGMQGLESAAVPLACLVGIVGFLFAVGLAMNEHPLHALALVIALPLVAGFYPAAVHVLAGAGGLAGAVLLGMGAVLVGLAAWGLPRLSMRRAGLLRRIAAT